MLILTLIFIFLFGLFFGSFATVLVTRWHEKKGGIISGRSACPQCHHTLSWYELMPFFSFVIQGGKCRHCKKKISLLYPFAELMMGVIFFLLSLGYFKIHEELFTPSHILLLLMGFITGIYILYDSLYMEIPDQALVPGIWGYILLLLFGLISIPISGIFFDRITYDTSYLDFLLDHIRGAIVLYTFFYLQILIPASWQLLQKKKWKEVGEIAISYFTFPFELLLMRKKPEEDGDDSEEIVTWVGGGDLRVALFIGITLGLLHGIIAVFIAYIVGSIVAIALLSKRQKKSHMIAFGPFLGIGWILALYFYDEILSYFLDYSSSFIL